MLERNRNLIVAFGVVAVVATFIGVWTWPIPPQLAAYGEENPRSGEYRPGGHECEPAALAAVRNVGERASKADACQKEAEQYRLNTNDLIQQTRAANAAQAQANIAAQGLWTGWLQTLGGFLTLTAAVAAAIYARDAAKESKRSADEAESSRKSFIEGERAHLAFADAYTKELDGGRVKLSFLFKNTGKSHAEIIGMAVEAVDGEVWPDSPLTFMRGLQVKVAAAGEGAVAHEMFVPVRLPALIIGYVQYDTLTLPDRKTFFAATIQRVSRSLGGSAYRLQVVEAIGHPCDT